MESIPNRLLSIDQSLDFFFDSSFKPEIASTTKRQVDVQRFYNIIFYTIF